MNLINRQKKKNVARQVMAKTRKKQVQLTSKEKEAMVKKIKLGGTSENLQALVESWNSENGLNHQIDISHLKRLKERILPGDSSATDFWETVCAKVTHEQSIHGSSAKYKPPTDKRDHNGRTTKVLDAEKVPLITEEQLTKLRFDFQREKYFKTGEGQKKQRSDFRDQLQSGIVCTKFSSFIGMDEEVRCMGALDDLLPSETGSIWKTVSDVVLTQEFGKHAQRQGNTFSDEHTVEDRVNPNYKVLKDYFTKKAPQSSVSALSRVLQVSEAVYRTVATLLPTNERKDSRRRTYPIMPELNPEWLSLLTALTKKTRVQREHVDDTEIGASGLWGLVANQYVIVWLGSYEMNLELERISSFYDFVMTKKPVGWTDAAFWNLVAGVHLENQVRTHIPNPPMRAHLMTRIAGLQHGREAPDACARSVGGGESHAHGLPRHPRRNALHEHPEPARPHVLGASRRPGRRGSVRPLGLCVGHVSQALPRVEVYMRGSGAV